MPSFNTGSNSSSFASGLKDGNLLTNVYNRVLRSLFYTWQKDFGGVVSFGEVTEEVLKDCTMSILKYEKLMKENKFHMVMYELDSLIRNANKYWVKNINLADANNDIELKKQTILKYNRLLFIHITIYL